MVKWVVGWMDGWTDGRWAGWPVSLLVGVITIGNYQHVYVCHNFKSVAPIYVLFLPLSSVCVCVCVCVCVWSHLCASVIYF